jgi:hypothetical protein
MDLLHFLKTRLKFIEQLYDGAVSPFAETKRKIEEHDPPYVDNRDPEYVSEPAFLEEWQLADDSVIVVGHWCLCMVQAAFKAYLEECIGPHGGYWWNSERLRAELAKKQGGSWFGRYRLLFLEDLGVDWSTGPVSLDELEQLNLTRDDLNHNTDIMSMWIERSEKHAERYPVGLFTDDMWAQAGLGIERVKVDKEKLLLAVQFVERFCTWLDAIRCNYPKYVAEGASPA